MMYNRQLEALPTEIILMISNHLPFKTYIQLSQSCKTIMKNLASTNCINYLNQRFNFGQDTGSLLLFTYYNILYIPRNMSKLVLHHYINAFKHDMQSVIQGWSLIHAIHCLDPGRFMTLLLADESETKEEEEAKYLPYLEDKKKLLAHHQRIFAMEIIDNIISSQIDQRAQVVKSKTYQSVFKNLVQSGDLRTVEICLTSLGPPSIDCVTINDSDYNNRFPLIDQQLSLSVVGKQKVSVLTAPFPIETEMAGEICRDSLYIHYNAYEMRILTEKLMEKYNVKVNNVSMKYTSYNRYNNNSHFNNTSSDFGIEQHHRAHYHLHRHRHRHRYYRYKSETTTSTSRSLRVASNVRVTTRIRNTYNTNDIVIINSPSHE